MARQGIRVRMSVIRNRRKDRSRRRTATTAPSARAATPLRFLRFAGSSLICTALDQLLAGLLFILLRNPLRGRGFLRIMVASVVARNFSQALNYVLNHHLVFTGDQQEGAERPSRRESLPRFLVVAATILALSTIGVYLLHSRLGIQESICKLVMDSLLFFLNYYLQQNWVFTTEPTIRPSRTRRKG